MVRVSLGARVGLGVVVVPFESHTGARYVSYHTGYSRAKGGRVSEKKGTGRYGQRDDTERGTGRDGETRKVTKKGSGLTLLPHLPFATHRVAIGKICATYDIDHKHVLIAHYLHRLRGCCVGRLREGLEVMRWSPP